MPWDQQKSKDASKKIRESQLALTYNVSFSGEEFDQLQYTMLLNRRLLDRCPEHGIIDRALSLVIFKLVEHWSNTAEGKALKAEERKAVGLDD